MSKGTIRKDLMDKLKSKINATRPRKGDSGMFEVTKSDENMLSSVKYVLSTGLRALDEMCGGLPFGRITEIYGLDGCGKTGVAIRSAIRAQQRHIYEKIRDNAGDKPVLKKIDDNAEVVVLYIDNEHSLDEDDKTVLHEEFGQGPGVRLKCLTAECDTVDQLFKIIDVCLDGIEAEAKAEDKEIFVVVIVDTIASTSSKEELNAEWGKVDYARQPKQLREGFRKMTRRLARQNVCLVCLNQVSDNYAAAQAGGHRPKYNTPQDDDFSTFGGRALKYYASLRIFMFKMKGKLTLIPKSKFQDGYIIGFRTTKNRQIKPGREGRLALIFDHGYKDSLSILETMLFLGFCEMGEKGDIRIRFRAHGLSAKPANTSLQDDDEKEDDRDTDPRIPHKGAWPAFYLANKESVDALWNKAVEYCFVDNAEKAAAEVDEDDGLIEVNDED